ncbi:MAG: adenylyl-sulfate kinase [Candidatus Eisenbacteria bacterium]|nr:adenylyl-sulfate kinase [Candidatus Eisenbacteria bacterium]
MSDSGRPGFAVWLTGLPSSGKTTIALRLQEQLSRRGVASEILDSDTIRKEMLPGLGYTPPERDIFYRFLAELGVLCTLVGGNILIAATAPERAHRQAAGEKIGRFAEVHVVCEPDVCRRRDPKGLWRKADAGEITALPGAGSPYDPPADPLARVDAARTSPDEAATEIEARLELLGWINGDG